MVSTMRNGAGLAKPEQRGAETARAAYRSRVAKLVCALLLGVCFWFSVPYQFPLALDADPMKAAASEASAYEGSLSRQIAVPVVLLITLYGLYRFPSIERPSARSKVLSMAVGYGTWAIASITWSDDPAITRKRLVVFAIDGLFCFALARLLSVLELAVFGFVCTGAVALIALCADVFVLHAFAPADPDYRFMGIMTANFQAMNLFVCLLCGLTLAQRYRRALPWLVPLLAFFAALLFLTRARIGAFLFVGALIFISVRMAKQDLQAHARAVMLLAVTTVLLPAFAFALGRSGQGAISSVFMMGRQDTENTSNLSNRAPLWAELMHSVEDRPLLGAGFEAFWSAEEVEKISLDQGWVVPHAHNTYLDQVLSLGLVGCFLYVGMLFGACCTAWKRYRRERDESTLFPALLLSWLILLSVTESIPVAPYLPTLIAYACVLKMCMKDGIEAEQRSTVCSASGRQLPAWMRQGSVLPAHHGRALP